MATVEGVHLQSRAILTAALPGALWLPARLRLIAKKQRDATDAGMFECGRARQPRVIAQPLDCCSTCGCHLPLVRLAGEYNVFGNVTLKDGVTYAYNDANQLTCARCSSASERRYAYDGAGNRVSDTGAAGVTYFMHGLGGLLLWESSATTREVKEYVYIQGKQLAVRRSRQ